MSMCSVEREDWIQISIFLLALHKIENLLRFHRKAYTLQSSKEDGKSKSWTNSSRRYREICNGIYWQSLLGRIRCEKESWFRKLYLTIGMKWFSILYFVLWTVRFGRIKVITMRRHSRKWETGVKWCFARTPWLVNWDMFFEKESNARVRGCPRAGP